MKEGEDIALSTLGIKLQDNGNGGQKINKSFGFQATLMNGHYVTEELAEIAHQIHLDRITKQQRITQKTQEQLEKARKLEQSTWYKCAARCGHVLKVITETIGVDWVFLTILGCLMAVLSFAMDYCIEQLLEAHTFMFKEAGRIHIALQIFTWIAFPFLLILFSTFYVHIVAPNAIGSGIPEMKTILRGVILKEYLTLRTLLSKMIGLTTSLGSGLPFGKEGPFVHIASIVATLLSKTFSSFRNIYENESRNSEMLSAAAATGVACTFAAPIGGVLFSIEVTATYFAVRNYWRGFFAAVCAAIVFRLLAIASDREETITALFKTSLQQEFPFDPLELVAFAILGGICGVAGAAFVLLHRKWIFLMRRNKRISSFLQQYRFLYPLIVTVLISALTCPNLTGQYMGGGVTFKQALSDFFSNVTWSYKDNPSLTIKEQEIISRWEQPYIWTSLTIYMIFLFTMSAVAITLPVPSGVFIPVFAMGAALGRMTGELMYTLWPDGINNGHMKFIIVPGGYAVVGAAAMSGAVTHTISTSMIVFELTGQMSHILPCVLAVLIANAIANALQPSIYDSIIQIKRLPYLPNFLPTNANAHRICAEDIMKKDMVVICYQTTYEQVRKLLTDNQQLRSFPLVETMESMILIGSVQRHELIRLLELHLGRERQQQLAASGDPAAEIMRDKKQGYKKKKKSPRRSPARSCSSDDEEGDGLRRNSAMVVLREKIKQGNYSTIGVTDASRRRSILKKSNSNPDLLASANASASQPRGPSAQEDGKKFGALPLKNLFNKKGANGSRETLNSQTSDDEKPPLRVVDLPLDQQMKWFDEQLKDTIDFEACHVDPAPFQLVEKTSLYKVHSLFSLLGLNHAYVINIGRLVGVVSLKELQKVMVEMTYPSTKQDYSDSDSDDHSVSDIQLSSSASHQKLDDILEEDIHLPVPDLELMDAREESYSPMILRNAISGPSIIDEEPQSRTSKAIAGAVRTLTSTIGGVEMEYNRKRTDSDGERTKDIKTQPSTDA